MKYRELYEKAKESMKFSYAPYSKFHVGAALLSKSGEIYTGVNVENSSFGATICAERSAMCKAVSEGDREWEAIAIVSSDGAASPCGICRQFMSEFADGEFKIITGNDEEHLDVRTLDELLPEAFKF